MRRRRRADAERVTSCARRANEPWVFDGRVRCGRLRGRALSACAIATDPALEAGHHAAAEIASGGIGEASMLVHQLVYAADIRLGLLHARHVEENQALAQMMIGAEGALRARRAADDGAGLAVPRA